MKKRQKDKELSKMWEFGSKIEGYLKIAREEGFTQAMERFGIKEEGKNTLSDICF